MGHYGTDLQTMHRLVAVTAKFLLHRHVQFQIQHLGTARQMVEVDHSQLVEPHGMPGVRRCFIEQVAARDARLPKRLQNEQRIVVRTLPP